MTRNTPGGKPSHSWDTKGFHMANSNELGAGTGAVATRPKGRIRRSMTACNTCRKLKTRCDLDPRSHACRRCISLRLVFSLLLHFSVQYARQRQMIQLLNDSCSYFEEKLMCMLPAGLTANYQSSRIDHNKVCSPEPRQWKQSHPSRNALHLLKGVWER